MIVAVAKGPPVSPLSRKVTVAVRCDSVSFAAKLTVTIWLLVELAGATEVSHEALLVVVHSQAVPPVVSANVVADAPFVTLRVAGASENEHGGRCVIV